MNDDAVEIILWEALESLRPRALPLTAFGATTREIRAKLLQLEQSTEPVVVAALQSQCEGYGQPPLTAYESTLAYMRVEWAYDHRRMLRQWDRFLHGPPADPELLPAEPYPILEYLLTTAWTNGGFGTTLGILEACDHAGVPPERIHDNS